MSRRILVIYTGGTIGMQPSIDGYVPMPGFHDQLVSLLDSRACGQLPAYDLIEFEQLIDSANLTPDNWLQMAQALAQHWNDYAGFVLLHGTDTLAYSASALSFMLDGINKPVILTGSQIPLAQLRNDALDNLVTAMLLAANPAICEVCICFNGRLLRGNRSVKVSSSGFDAFDSPNFPWLGRVGIDFELQPQLLLAAGTPGFRLAPFDADAVAVLPLYPGIGAHIAEAILTGPGIRALVLQTYGAGNPPDANQALMQVLENASQRGITLLNITQCARGGVSQGTYATGATLNRIGVIPGSDLTLEAAFAKLHVLIANGISGDALHSALGQPLCGELTQA
ncbi:asparaginase domain-containing protein [Marinobacterium rhizophilum]|uniref:Asparaginase n=1 Tax=Marinobacterium rhizophilum TaxID=420402 RepID=A0ABY5HII7_9GAMM|nr:asparaginase domain-containing protein [Marinobacterium rhizophilum]UTW11647.1 asparaginase [Marinobacterium rhizophilum]